MEKWPEDYQDRIERIIGAKFDDTKDGKYQLYFLVHDYQNSFEAMEFIKRAQTMQKQLRRIITEVNLKIRDIKVRKLARPKKSDGAMYELGYLITSPLFENQIVEYKYVIHVINQLLITIEKQITETELWIDQYIQINEETPFLRQSIPDEVKIFVWNRDSGKCVNCGSQNNLEFDHIIPISKGGSNTSRNIQLLCETCNRIKAARIG